MTPTATTKVRPVRRLMWAGAASAVGMTFALGSPLTAHADSTAHQDMAKSYSSLTAAMLNMHAKSANLSLSEYLTKQNLLLTPVAGEAATTSPEADTEGTQETLDVNALAQTGGMLLDASSAQTLKASSDTVETLSAATLDELNAKLASAGGTLSTSKFTSMEQLAKTVASQGNTLDGAVTLSATKWLASLGELRTPKLSTPTAGAAKSPTVKAADLPFGLLMNKSLTNMVTNFPDLINTATKSGLGSSTMQDAWNKSMATAYAQTGKDLEAAMPNRCVATVFKVMATGDQSTKTPSGCSSSCVTVGAYLHYQSGAAFDDKQNSVLGKDLNPVQQLFTPSQTMYLNPGAVAKLKGASTSILNGQNVDIGGCQSAQAGAKASLNATMPSIISKLRK